MNIAQEFNKEITEEGFKDIDEYINDIYNHISNGYIKNAVKSFKRLPLSSQEDFINLVLEEEAHNFNNFIKSLVFNKK